MYLSEATMRKLVLVTISAALAGCAEPAQTPADTEPTTAVEAAGHPAVTLTTQQEQGREIYEAVCWTCHGPAGRGDGPAVKVGSVAAPPTFHQAAYTNVTAAALERRFRTGLQQADARHPHMQFVASLLKEESFGAALSYVPALVYPPEIPGSAINGERIYQFRCAGCHGQTGRGDGPGAELLVELKPADFTTDTLVAAGDWGAVFSRVREGGRSVHGSTMPPWGIVLSDDDIWDVVAYLATFQQGLVAPPGWGS
jgi:mono/diheme cytochrome c family protein